ncbi:CPBP family intramembrane metalloprotease [candidate division KSB1 bacterium]|nr:CPBP family intramembrane metalloprotease [candidate division KSB1 bacterium]
MKWFLNMESNDNNTSALYPTQKQALAVVLITMLLTFILGIFGMLLGLHRTELFLVEIFTIVPALIFVYRKNLSPIRVFRLRAVNKNIIFSAVLIGLTLSVLSDEADRLINQIFPMPEAVVETLKQAIQINTWWEFILIGFSAVILASVCEEMLFRGFLQTSFENSFDVTKAVMLTALLFGIVHFNPWWTIQLIIFGIFLGVLAWKSKSIIPSMVVHGINNGLSLIFHNTDEKNIEWYLWKDHVDPYIILIAAVVFIYGFKLFYSYCEELHASKKPNDDHSQS